MNFWDPVVQSSRLRLQFRSVPYPPICIGKLVQFSSIRYRYFRKLSSFSSKFTQFSSVERSVQVGDRLLLKPCLACTVRDLMSIAHRRILGGGGVLDHGPQQDWKHIGATFPNRLGADGEKCSKYHQNSAKFGLLFRFDSFSCYHWGPGPSQRDIKLRP